MDAIRSISTPERKYRRGGMSSFISTALPIRERVLTRSSGGRLTSPWSDIRTKKFWDRKEEKDGINIMAHIIPAQSGTQCVYLTNLYLIKTFREKYHVSRLISNKVSPTRRLRPSRKPISQCWEDWQTQKPSPCAIIRWYKAYNYNGPQGVQFYPSF